MGNTEAKGTAGASAPGAPTAKTFAVATSPHIRVREDAATIMWAVNLALVPAVVASSYIFGLRGLLVILLSSAVCVACEAVAQLAFGKKVTVADGSALLTGILLAFNLPATVPWWMVVIGGVVAIFLVKQLFGGLGYNIFNPALAARAVLLASWPVAMTTWSMPVRTFGLAEAVSAASPLGIVKEAARAGLTPDLPYRVTDLLLGNIPGSLGETCKAALLLGAVVLIAVKIVDWRIPIPFIATVAVLSLLFGRDPLVELLSGGLILGAFYMATDLVTSPTTRTGRVIFGCACGLLTTLTRNFGGFPEGVCYSILFMNMLAPLMERFVQPRRFGT
jgi:electron transport complex protein RnfD